MTQLADSFDFVIVGSGFGGSVSALRLAEKGYKVLVIEQGKRFAPGDFPRTNWNLRRWLWFPALGFRGIQKLNFLRHASIMSGVGVGGGSLVYANTLPKPKPAFYSKGSWAGLADWEKELAPFYDQALEMLGAVVNPKLFDNDLAFKTLAENIGKPEHFSPTTVAVYFGEPETTVADPFFGGQGPERSGCRHCGACMTGCRYNAKNTLDKNYLYLAEKLGVEVLPEKKVISVVPIGTNGSDGYEIIFRNSLRKLTKKNSVRTKGVIFAGGVMGTVPLLLKLRKATLPRLSALVGEMVRTNNEALIHNTTINKSLELHKGIAIGSILEFDENSHVEPVRYGEGSGFWRLTMLPMVSDKSLMMRLLKVVSKPFGNPTRWTKVFFAKDFGRSSSILLFMQHLDSTISLKRGLFGIKTKADKAVAPTPFIPEAHIVANHISKIIDGEPLLMVNEILAGIPSTAHILGGACMGKDDTEGVIDSQNRVFGYENMFVFDGSMISANPGVNPSLSIAAITERGMNLIPAKK